MLLFSFKYNESYLDWVRVAHFFSVLCCPIMYLYVLSSVL